MVDVEQAGRRGDEVCLRSGLAKPPEKPYRVDGARRAGDADDDARRVARLRGVNQAATPSVGCSSPASYISVMMSEPPTNSPFT